MAQAARSANVAQALKATLGSFDSVALSESGGVGIVEKAEADAESITSLSIRSPGKAAARAAAKSPPRRESP
jgi:hypothetical protein